MSCNNKLKTYVKCEKGNNLILKIFSKYHPSFSSITIYGDEKNPLFISSEIGAILHIITIRTSLKNFNDTEKFKGLVDKGQNVPIREHILLTKYGLYRIMFTSNTDISALFRTFVYKLFDQLEETGIATLEETTKRLEKEVEEQKQKAIMWEQEAEKQKNNVDILTENLTEMKLENNYDKLQNQQLISETDKYFNILNQDDYYIHDNLELNLLRKHFLKKQKLYLIDPKIFNKKKKNTDDYESDIEINKYDNLTYEFELYNKKNTPDLLDDMYYTLSSQNKYSTYVYDLYYLKSDDIDKLKNYLNRCHTSNMKNIFKTSLQEIIDFLRFEIIKQLKK